MRISAINNAMQSVNAVKFGARHEESNGYQTRPHNAGIVKAVPLAVLIAMSPMTTASSEVNYSINHIPQPIEVAVADKGDVLLSEYFKDGSMLFGDGTFKLVSTEANDSQANVVIEFSKDADQPANGNQPYRHIRANASISPDKLVLDHAGFWVIGSGRESYNIYGAVGSDEYGKGRYIDEGEKEGIISIAISQELYEYIENFYKAVNSPIQTEVNASKNLVKADFHNLSRETRLSGLWENNPEGFLR